MTSTQSSRTANRLLAGLPSKERARFLDGCTAVDLLFGGSLHKAGEPIAHVFFPLDALISLVAPIDDHQPLEMGLIGSEGMLGATTVLGIRLAAMRAVVQGSGAALRMSTSHFLRQLAASPLLTRAINRYLYVMMAQLMQSAACTRFHEIEPRLARWLLMTHDRVHADQFHMTHEYLAGMLGVRRSGISIAAAALQMRHLIEYSRGDIRILNRRGLETAACGCYRIIVKQYQNVFG